MNTIIQNNSLKNKMYNWFFQPPVIQPQKDQTNERIASVMHTVINKEQEAAKKTLANTSKRYPMSVIGGDLLNIGALGLQGISAFVKCGILADMVLGLGLVAGVFNLKEGFLSCEEGLHAWKSNDKALAMRLGVQGVLKCLLGVGMMLFSIAKFAGIASISAFFVANPYILPALFCTLALIWLIEILHRLGPVINKTDLASKLDLPKLEAILQKPNQIEAMREAKEWVYSKLKDCGAASQSETSLIHEKTMRDKLDYFKSEMGFLAAMETFHLFEKILQNQTKKEIIEQIAKVKQQVTTWNQLLYLKLFSILLCTAGFGIGMAAFGTNCETMDGAQNLAMSASTVIPLYLDTKRPFEREVQIVVERPDESTNDSSRKAPPEAIDKQPRVDQHFALPHSVPQGAA